MKEIYNTNEAFKEYVDKYCIKHNITLEMALQHEMIKGYALWMKQQGKL